MNFFREKKKVNFSVNGYEVINFLNLSDDEIEMVRKWRNEKSIRMWMYNDQIISMKEHKNFLKTLEHSSNKLYWLVKKNSDYLGVIDLPKIDWINKNAYLGIYANPERKIKGIGSILLSIILEISFNLFELHTLKLEVIENNISAINLYKKFGFKEEGKLKEFVLRNDKWMDVIIMGKINPKQSDINNNES